MCPLPTSANCSAPSLAFAILLSVCAKTHYLPTVSQTLNSSWPTSQKEHFEILLKPRSWEVCIFERIMQARPLITSPAGQCGTSRWVESHQTHPRCTLRYWILLPCGKFSLSADDQAFLSLTIFLFRSRNWRYRWSVTTMCRHHQK